MSTRKDNPIVEKVEKFLDRWVTFAQPYHRLPVALWAIATHTWPTFDVFPYMTITAFVKRAGKTQLMELLQWLSSNGRTYSAASPASMMRDCQFEQPSMFIDEAEKLNEENHPARELLNKGYKRGQEITRIIGNKVVRFDPYCPKCFVLIGDTYDTLRDRSLIIIMRRRTPMEDEKAERYVSSLVKAQAEALREEISAVVTEAVPVVESAYRMNPGLRFLGSRDAEIWLSLFSICEIFAPSRMTELTRCAVDIASEKTFDRRDYTELLRSEEKAADDLEASVLLLRDMLTLTKGKSYIPTATLIDELKGIPTSGWRRFRGEDGLSPIMLAELMSKFNVQPKYIRLPGTSGTKKGNPAYKDKAVVRGYKRDDLLAAAKLTGLVRHD